MKPNATASNTATLLIEVDHELSLACRGVLQQQHIVPLISASLPDALALLAHQPVGLVVIAARSDDAQVIRALHHWPAMPVIWLHSDGDDAVPEPGCLRGLLHQVALAQLPGRINQLVNGPAQPVARDVCSVRLYQLGQRVAATDATVLITGESGVGKEILARYIHTHSSRQDTPLVAINCAAIPETMLEAELFGFERGAFTGATQSRIGQLEAAAGGTVLLDEVSEMTPGLQAKLLRVLQENEVVRLGSNRIRPLDLRIIATSNRNLPEEVAAGRFREDLYYRLSVLPLHIEPLRKRCDDIAPLALRLLAEQTISQCRRQLSDEALQVICAHRWPGNVRELSNAVARALIYCQDHVIGGATMTTATHPLPPAAGPLEVDLEQTRRKAESRRILQALSQGQGSRQYAAEQLGISQRTLRYKLAQMKEQGIAIPG